MDNQRMDILYKQIHTMDSTLVDILDNYKNFSESTQPVVTVLCSDNTLRQKMDMLFGGREDISAKVYGTFDKQAAENELNALMSDAVVVCTKAKNIAPKDMFDCVKTMNSVNKPIYVLLAGWEALPKTPEMICQRRERIGVEFPFARIEGITCVYTDPMEGLCSFEDGVDDLCRRFTRNFDKLHSNQDEALYGYVKGYVSEYYTKARSQINNVITELNKCQKDVMIKHNFFKTRFSSLDVRFQETADLITKAVSDISYYSLVDSSTQETLDDIYSENGVSAQAKAKKLTTDLMLQRLIALEEEKENSIRVAANALVVECESDMTKIIDRVSSLPYVSQNDIEQFEAACRNTGCIAGIPERYADYKDALMKKIAERIPAKIKAYEFDMNISIKMRDAGKSILRTLKDAYEDDNSDNDSKKTALPIEKPNKDLVTVHRENPQDDFLEKKPRVGFRDKMPDEELLSEFVNGILPAERSERNDENEKALMLERFRDDVDAMIANAKNAVSSEANSCIRDIKNDIERTCTDMLKTYFDRVLSTLSGICANTAKKLSEFDLEQYYACKS